MRQIYKIAIEEHLVREIEIEASSVDEALQKAADKWKSEVVVLDADDFARALMSCVSPEPTEWEEID